jgi:hypothetical protein
MMIRVLAYCDATIIAVGLWALFNFHLLRRRQLTVQSLLLLTTTLAIAWTLVTFLA